MASWKKIIVSGSDAHLNSITASAFGGNISGSAASTGSFAKLRLSDSIELNTSTSTDGIIHSGGDNGAGTGNNLLLYTGKKAQAYTSLIDIEPGNSGNIVLNPSGDILKSYGRLQFHESYLVTTSGTNDLILNTRDGSTPWAGYGDSSQIIVESDTNAGIKLYTHGTGTVYISGSSAGNKLEVVGGIKATGNISGSATSTGSFGRVEATTFVGDGSGLTGLTSAAIETYNTSGDNRILTSVNSSTVQGEAGLTFDGSELRVQGDIVAESFIVSSSVTHMTQSFSSGSTIFGDTSDDTHQFTGSLNISGSTNTVTINAAGSDTVALLLKGDVQSKTPIIKFATDGGNVNSSEITATNAGFQFSQGITSTGGLKGTSLQTHEINTFSNGKDAIDIGEGYTGGIRWGYVEIFSNDSNSWTAGQAQLTVAPASGSLEGIKIVGNDLQTGDYIKIQSGSSDILNITHNGSVSGSSISTGSFGHITTPGGIDAVGPISFQTSAAANDIKFQTPGTSGYPLTLRNSDNSARMYFQTNTGVTNIIMDGNSKSNLLKLSADGLTETRGQVGSAHADGNLELYSNNGLNNLILSASMTTISGSGDTTLDVKGNILSEGNITVGGNLTVQGDTIQQQVANLNVEDRFILLNSGSASGDGGLVVQTESADGDGVAFAYDDSESRWSFQQGTKLNASASAVAPDAYASAVVTSDDSNYQKNGNIRVEGGEIYIYVE